MAAKASGAKGLPGEGAAILGVVAMAALMLAAFPGRADYTGHFLAGAGATLLLLGLAAASLEKPQPWTILAVCLAAVGMGAIAEATVFRLAAYDWVDFAVQSMGAVLVTAPFLEAGKRRQPSSAMGLAAFGDAAGRSDPCLGLVRLACCCRCSCSCSRR
ncbi:MAG: hypothetical protein ACT4QG_21640 [Sporichthyaceae bacterium]